MIQVNDEWIICRDVRQQGSSAFPIFTCRIQVCPKDLFWERKSNYLQEEWMEIKSPPNNGINLLGRLATEIGNIGQREGAT